MSQKSIVSDISQYSSHSGRNRISHVANQYLYSDGRCDQKSAQHRGVRGGADLAPADLRPDWKYSRSADTANQVNATRRPTMKLKNKITPFTPTAARSGRLAHRRDIAVSPP